MPTALSMHLKFDALALVERSYLTNFCLVYIRVIKSIGCSRIILLQPIFCGRYGIRTHATCYSAKRFPSVPLQPLE